jgi:hypothetical protein
MNNYRILYTRHDNGVNVCSPATPILKLMENGGGWYDDKAHANGLHDRHGNSVSARMRFNIDRKVAHGNNPKAATRLIKALAHGGCTTAEALDIIRENDCEPHGVAFELITADQLQYDRWFRNAWRRSKNGGPIWINMDEARIIQAEKIQSEFNKLTSKPDPEQNFAARFKKIIPKIIELNWDRLERLIREAETPETLRAIWPIEFGENNG